jgi:hypothetical protein
MRYSGAVVKIIESNKVMCLLDIKPLPEVHIIELEHVLYVPKFSDIGHIICHNLGNEILYTPVTIETDLDVEEPVGTLYVCDRNINKWLIDKYMQDWLDYYSGR